MKFFCNTYNIKKYIEQCELPGVICVILSVQLLNTSFNTMLSQAGVGRHIGMLFIKVAVDLYFLCADIY